jgi:hypothetical protein
MKLGSRRHFCNPPIEPKWKERTMSATVNTAEGDLAADESRFNRLSDGVTSFLLAGAVLFASLVIGSAVSLHVAGSDAVMAAIMRGFLSLGLAALAAFLVATLVAIGFAAFRRSRDAA